MNGKTVRIANAGGYWGDDPEALRRQLLGPRVDYVCLDFLAETTMSILQKQRKADPGTGFAHDFVGIAVRSLPEILEKKVRVVTNAGGVNPLACARALEKAASSVGLAPKIAVVVGDDLLERVPELRKKGSELKNGDTGEGFPSIETRLSAANIYFGAQPIAEALRLGADIVLTGRVVDAGLTLGPLLFEYGWGLEDWDRLASGVVAGHLLECGAQVTGGNHTDWRKVKRFDSIGYPIAEFQPDGSFVLTKHPGTGGLVSLETVKEQLLYEIGDPTAYLTPDVTADFTSARLEAVGEDRVRVSGVKGSEPSQAFKVSMAYDNGFRVTGGVLVAGPDALEKARTYADLFWKRCPPLEETRTEYLGWNAFYGRLGSEVPPDECLLRFSARSNDKKRLAVVAKLIPSLILSGPPGITFTGGIPKVQEVVSYWPTLIPKPGFDAKVGLCVGASAEPDWRSVSAAVPGKTAERAPAHAQKAVAASRDLGSAFSERASPSSVPLGKLCLVRSGDKGDKVNLGVVARSAESYRFLKEQLTAQRIKDWFQELALGEVTRYELDNVESLNFVLDKALGGGGATTLRMDALGKGLGQALVRQKIEIPAMLRAQIK